MIVKVAGAEVPPPGSGFETVTLAVPGLRMSLSRIKALSCEALTNVVFRFEFPNLTIEPVTKPDPTTVSVKSGPPATADEGLIELMTGNGLLMVNRT